MSIERVIAPRRRRVGASEVDRLLPFHARRMVGPFIFADLIGPEELAPGVGSDVPPHPHIGLATVTYLFDGAMVHRDSTGAVQRIDPGGVNWMTAGAGVAHSERSPDDARAVASPLAGLQTWVALPDGGEEVAPSFQHAAADALPAVSDGGVAIRLLVGTGYGAGVAGAGGVAAVPRRRDRGARRPLRAAGRAPRASGAGRRRRRRRGRCRHRAAAPGGGGTRRRRRHLAGRGPGDDVRGRARRAALHLVELRGLDRGAHRGRQGRLGRPPLR